MGDTPSRAAAKVFGIVELLEQILIALAMDKDLDIMKQPVVQLFALKQVNTTFCDIITRNKTLRYYMWLTPVSVGPGGFNQVKDAFYSRDSWLFERLGKPLHLSFGRLRQDKSDKRGLVLRPGRTNTDWLRKGDNGKVLPIGRVEVTISPIAPLKSDPTKNLEVFLRREASWRQMLEPNLRRGVVKITTVVLPDAEPKTAGDGGPWWDSMYRFTCESGKGQTLGFIAEKYLQLFRRSEKKHRWARANYLKRNDGYGDGHTTQRRPQLGA